MGEAICDAVSFEGFTCNRAMGHINTHCADDALWGDGPNRDDRRSLCFAITGEPGPLPSRCNKDRDHDGAHEATEHGHVIHGWVDQ